jgi:hypothetical protein
VGVVLAEGDGRVLLPQRHRLHVARFPAHHCPARPRPCRRGRRACRPGPWQPGKCASLLSELLALNASGRPNGHTPYSAYLALAALLVGYLRGSPMVLAGNSRSDDEPNVGSYLGMPVNHQWTKSHEFEAALGGYRDRWLPGAPLYSSPLRPLLELQIIRSLEPHMDAYLKTASCNKTKGLGWCRKCAKCAWVFLATSGLFGHDLAVSKAGGDLFADPGLSGLYEAMAGLPGARRQAVRVHRYRGGGPLGHPGRRTARRRPARPRHLPARRRRPGRPAVRRGPQGLGPGRPDTRSPDSARPPRRARVAEPQGRGPVRTAPPRDPQVTHPGLDQLRRPGPEP